LGELLIVGFCYLALIREEKNENLKNSTFSLLRQTGFEPTTNKKWQNRMSNFASALVPSSGTCPGFIGLGGNRGKYIYESN
jgi:hypothetical protein